MELSEHKEVVGEFGGGGGGGGGGGAPPHTPVEYDDTLSSRQTVRLLFAVNDGEIEGVEQIYLNRTPIGNILGASWDWRPGNSWQGPIPGFSETETPMVGFSSVEIKTTTPYTRSVDYDVTAVRVTLTVPSLQIAKDNGDIIGHSVQLSAYTKGTEGGFPSFFASTRKVGKASSQYSWDIRIERPSNAVPDNKWQFIVMRDTPDESSVKRANKTQISAITEIRHHAIPLSYPNTAIIGITLRNAEQFGGRIPEVTFKVKGMRVFTPHNYDAYNRAYNGNWTYGKWKLHAEWTDNPVWLLLHVLKNKMGITEQDIDLGSFYNEAMYADQFVSNGKGGFEPRFTINNQFIQRENPPTFLMYLLTLINGQFTDNEFGQIKLVTDRAGRAVTKIVNNTNVVDGEFVYSSNEIDSRFSLVNVTYNNPIQMGDTETTTEDDDYLINRYGLQTSDIVLAGCYSEAQAKRKARWVMWVNARDTELISFSIGLAGMNYHIGELVKIQDSYNTGFEHQGMVVSASSNISSTTLTLDRELELGAEDYKITFLDANGSTIVEKIIAQKNGTFNVVSFTGVNVPLERSPFTLETATKKPLIGRVISVKKDGDTCGITCVRHSEQKYVYIESNVTVPPPSADFVNLSGIYVSPPSNISVSQMFSSDGVMTHSQLHVTWDWNTSGAEKIKAKFQLLWRRDNQAFRSINDLSIAECDIDNPIPGQYDFVVYAINPVSGLKSAASPMFVYNYRNNAGQSSLDPVVSAFVQGTNGTEFRSSDLLVVIEHNPSNDVKVDKLLDYIVEVWDVSGASQKGTYIIPRDTGNGGLFRLTYVENAAIFGTASRNVRLKIFCRDLRGDLSLPADITYSNPPPALVNFSIISGMSSAYVNIKTAQEQDVKGYMIWRGDVDDFVKDHQTLVYDGPDNYVAVPIAIGTTIPPGGFRYAVAAYDSFDTNSLNISTEQVSVPITAEVDKFAFVGLEFTPNSPSANFVSWGAAQVTINGGSEQTIPAGSAEWSEGMLYLYFNKYTGQIESSTDITIAVQMAQILAAYEGGANLKGGDGSAFINGAQILAQSVGANHLVTNTAIITQAAQLASAIVGEAHINNGAVTNLKIGNRIQSTDFSDVNKVGWRIDKQADITAYGRLKIETRVGNSTVFFQNDKVLKISDTAGHLRVRLGDLTQ